MMPRIFRSRTARVLGIFLGGGLLLVLFHQPLLLLIGDHLIIRDDLHPADVIHVIAGEDYRTDYSIQLYKKGLGRTIFFTGGLCKNHGYHHGEHGRDRSLAQGVPPDAIAIDDASVTSTYMELERLKEWIARSPIPIRSVIIVSDPFHMRRTRWACRRILGRRMDIQMAPVPFDQTPYHRHWWSDRASRRYVWDEYGKSVYYVLRYQISRGRFRDWLASKDRR